MDTSRESEMFRKCKYRVRIEEKIKKLEEDIRKASISPMNRMIILEMNTRIKLLKELLED